MRADRSGGLEWGRHRVRIGAWIGVVSGVEWSFRMEPDIVYIVRIIVELGEGLEW